VAAFRRTSLLLQPWAAEPARRRLTVTESAALGPNTEPGCRLGFRISWPLAAGPPSRPGPAAVVTQTTVPGPATPWRPHESIWRFWPWGELRITPGSLSDRFPFHGQ